MEGIITTPPSKNALLLAGVVTTVIAMFGLVIGSYADAPVPNIPAFLPVVLVATFLVDALTAYLLVVHFAIFRQPAIGIVAAAYGFAACAGLLQLTAFPGVFADQGLFGASSQSASWIGVFWHTGFPLLILAAVLVQAGWRSFVLPKERIAYAVLVCCSAPILLAAALNWLALRHTDLLPGIVHGPDFSGVVGGPIGTTLWAANAAAVIALVAVTRLRSVFFLWLTVSVFAEFVEVALFLGTAARDTLGWYAAFGGRLASAVVLLTALLWEAHRLYPLLAKANEDLYWVSIHDPLTGLFNRRHFTTQLEEELVRARRLGLPVSLLMADLDHFKQCNDEYGHLYGDQCLAAFAGLLRAHAQRPGDFAARYGGEEFAVVLVGASTGGAADIAEQIRREVEHMRTAPPSQSALVVVLTLSVGVATLEHGDPACAEHLIAAADRALYKAKEAGRNRVCVAQSEQPRVGVEVPDCA